VPSPAIRSDPARPWFWVLFSLCFAALAFPLWYGEMPPLTDFGGHVQLAHGAIGASDPTSVWHGLVETAPWWHPNGVWVRLATWFAPLVPPLTVLRLGFTLSLLVGALGQLHLLRTFGRSRWLVFVALPFLMWNGMAALGFVNFVPTIALVPWAISAAHRLARADRPTVRDPLVLGLLAVLAVWFHGLGGPLVIACAGLVLVTSVRAPRRLVALAALAPATVYWATWLFTTAPTGPATSSRDGFWTWLRTFQSEALGGVLGGPADDVVFYLLVSALALHLLAGRPPTPAGHEEPIAPGPLRLRVLRRLANRPLAWLLLALVVGYRLLPRYRGDVALAERLIPAILIVACALPRPPLTPWARRLARAATTLAIASGLAFAALVGEATMRFDAQELGRAMPLIEQIPSNSRAQCVSLRLARPIFDRRIVDHNCDGVLAARRGAFAGGGFADTPHNAIRFAPGVAEHRIADDRWSAQAELALVDHLLVRGPHAAPRSDWAELVGTVLADDGAPAWTLYRSRLSSPPPVGATRDAGGTGGSP
jgi:hypothetical protein